jgi:hypothetical protein
VKVLLTSGLNGIFFYFQAAQSIQCKTCFQTFQQTAKLPE